MVAAEVRLLEEDAQYYLFGHAGQEPIMESHRELLVGLRSSDSEHCPKPEEDSLSHQDLPQSASFGVRRLGQVLLDLAAAVSLSYSRASTRSRCHVALTVR